MIGLSIALALVCIVGLFGHACEHDRARGKPVDEDSAGWFAVLWTAATSAIGYCAEAIVRGIVP